MALHEDVTGQERTSERLFEEEIELKWEKGGSGLVFYTDAQFWQEEEGGTASIRQGQGWSLLLTLLAVSPTRGLGKRLTLLYLRDQPSFLGVGGQGSGEKMPSSQF